MGTNPRKRWNCGCVGGNKLERENRAIYEGGLDGKGYQHILEQALVPRAKALFKDQKGGWELQQDKATPQTSKSTTRFLEQKGIAVVEGWPTKGDDINPMENLWAILDERLEQKKFHTKKSMEKAVRSIWDNVDKRVLYKRSLIPSQTACAGL